VVENDDLLGDGVNVAARLEQLSGKPFIYVGDQRLKNIARPIRAYQMALDYPLQWPCRVLVLVCR
jgi:adenylate cyclase